jgi:hypothetical protein
MRFARVVFGSMIVAMTWLAADDTATAGPPGPPKIGGSTNNTGTTGNFTLSYEPKATSVQVHADSTGATILYMYGYPTVSTKDGGALPTGRNFQLTFGTKDPVFAGVMNACATMVQASKAAGRTETVQIIITLEDSGKISLAGGQALLPAGSPVKTFDCAPL